MKVVCDRKNEEYDFENNNNSEYNSVHCHVYQNGHSWMAF